MVDSNVISIAGSALSESTIQDFEASLAGELLRPGDEAYDTTRQVWNAMIDKYPALIVRCTGVADVITSVNFARDNDLLVAVRGGGHNVAGNAVCDGGIMIDLSPMTSVRVDPTKRRAWAQAGLRGRDFDHETSAFGLASTLGTVSDTGIAGLTLGGGFGWLMRKYGLACDNLISADVVLADGRFVTASATENADLFWGLRGGGGNFGIVTAFEYQLHPVDQVLGGMVIHPISKAKEVFEFHRDYTSNAPEELAAYVMLVHTPEGEPAAAMLTCYHGPPEKGEQVLKPLREFGPPVMDGIRAMPYKDFQTSLDAGFEPGLRFYLKAGLIDTITDEFVDTILDYFLKAPSKRSVMAIEHLGGAINRVNEDETAFNFRNTSYDLEIFGVWTDPAKDQENIEWTRQVWQGVQPFFADGVYVNYLTDDERDRIKSAYGSNYDRLVALKNKYDPTNLFRRNQNIKPTV